jgi:hypothetical protein
MKQAAFKGDPGMSWHLQQINNAGGKGATVRGEPVACRLAIAPTLVSSLFVCAFGYQQHFAYLDGNGNIQDCWYDGQTKSWNLQQINNATGHPTVPGEFVACPQAAAGADTGPFVCSFGYQQHFAYVDGDGNIQDCWYDGQTKSWNLQQINNALWYGPTVAGEFVACPQAPGIAKFSSPFVCAFGDQLHFAYFDTNDNIQDCWYDGQTKSWNLQQINNGTGHPTVPGEFVACPQATAPTSVPSLFVCAFGDQLHFAYVDGYLNIQDCWYDGKTSSWNVQQINNAGGNGPSVAGEFVARPQAPEAGGAAVQRFLFFVCAFGDQMHFAYIDAYFNIQDCWYDGKTNSWNLQQINNATGHPTVPGEPIVCPQAPAVAQVSNLFVCAYGDQMHFGYFDTNGNIQDCWYDGKTNSWNLQQVNNAGGHGPTVAGEFVACPQAAAEALVGNTFLFVCTFGGQQHYAYVDGNGNIQDCYWDGGG